MKKVSNKFYQGALTLICFGDSFRHTLSLGNRTEWRTFRSVIIRVINKIGRPRTGSPICLITSMITHRIGRHEVLLPINHNFNKICDIIGYFLNQNKRNSKFGFLAVKKKSHLSARVMVRTPGTRSSDFVNHEYDYTPNWTTRSSVTN